MSFSRVDNFHLWWSFYFFVILLVPSFALNSDGTLLLSFKYSILSDPLSLLDNWDYSDDTPCSWTGITCAEIGTAPDMFRVISLVLPNSHLQGSIPGELGLIQYLRSLDLSANFFNGTLPISLFNASDLQVLSLSNNVISGELPEFIGGLKRLQYLNLSDNAFSGKVPENLSSLANLTVVSLRSNNFSGSIPSGFQYVEVLDFSSNFFNGSLPLDFGGNSLHYINLSYNNLSGSVSQEFVNQIPENATIDLSFNNLTGEIPPSIALSNQKTKSFAGNIHLCGKPLNQLCPFPSTTSNPPNVSTNTTSAAIAAIPKTITSTPLPNSPTGTKNQTPHRLNPGTIAGIAVGDLVGIGILAIIFLYIHQLRKKRKTIAKLSSENREFYTTKNEVGTWFCLNIEETSDATGSDSDENNKKSGIQVECENGLEKFKKESSLVMVDGETELELETLLKASAYILGSSGSGIVYKAVLENGLVFAVRRIGESGVERLKEFENQVRGIAKLRHPNLVAVRGFYWGEDEKLVIYDYVSNGSLASAGYKRIGSSPCHLSFNVRLTIAKGLARGLTYIHEKKQVHGNIKPSNILLTSDMEPIISDFGLHFLLSGKPTHETVGSTRNLGSNRFIQNPPSGFVGSTTPYHAPESLKNLKPNPKWDVYSFGIVLLELLTGRVFSEGDLSRWTAGSVVEDKHGVLRMADVAIRGDVERREDDTLALFKLGFGCGSVIPQKRPSMKDALQVLEKMQFS